MDNIIKTVKSLDEFGLIVKGQSQAIEKKKKKTKEKEDIFFSILLGTLSASLSGNRLAGKGVVPAVEEIIRTGQNV